jgi:type II secretory pathway pseudopilin PulG
MKILHDEEGLGLVEIVVSMFMLALLAMAFLPFLIQSLTATKANTTLATATQVVAKQMDDLRLISPATCTSLTAFRDLATAVQDTTRHVTLSVQRSFTCPASLPATATVTIAVLDTSTNATLAKASTVVFVSGS